MAQLLASTGAGAAWASVMAGVFASVISIVAMLVVTRRGVTVEDSHTRAKQLQECQAENAQLRREKRELRDEVLDLHRQLRRQQGA